MVKKNREMIENPVVYEDLVGCQEIPEMTLDQNHNSNENQENMFDNLTATLNKICEQENIFGYILKNNVKANINLKETGKIIELAMLSSQAFESAEELSASFKIGEISNIVVEGTDIKLLCININENALSVFMDKTVDHSNILERILF